LFEEKMMKLIHSAILALAIGAATVSTAQARDSFSLGINVGGYGYAPPVAYYPAPVYYSEPVYYSQPVTYYRPAPRYYGYAPTVVSFGYQNYGGHHYNRHHDNRGGNHGWSRGHDRGHRGGHDRGDDRGRGHR
jgi:hypothetical protein